MYWLIPNGVGGRCLVQDVVIVLRGIFRGARKEPGPRVRVCTNRYAVNRGYDRRGYRRDAAPLRRKLAPLELELDSGLSFHSTDDHQCEEELAPSYPFGQMFAFFWTSPGQT